MQISNRNNINPNRVENTPAISTIVGDCGHMLTNEIPSQILCSLQMDSIFGRMHLQIMRGSRWAARSILGGGVFV